MKTLTGTDSEEYEKWRGRDPNKIRPLLTPEQEAAIGRFSPRLMQMDLENKINELRSL